MPIYSYHCTGCNKKWDEIRHVSEKDEPATCTNCESPADRRITTIGGYKGDLGGSSTRPKNSTSFKGVEQLEFDFKKED